MDVMPDKQNIDNLFSNTTYHIDFYQRQYKWDDDPVKRLLEDIFYKFNSEYENYKNKDIELDKLIEKYSWYYLNTYVTNSIDGKVYIVDGQQRLTTLTLILMKLRHLSNVFESQLESWISIKIVGHSGFRKEFWMNHEQSKEILEKIYENPKFELLYNYDSITDMNLGKNYITISNFLDKELYDKKKFETFVFYFLKRLVLINLVVEQIDVPMVFEVINDRGVRLKPHEILKGKLLGQIDKEELDELKLNELWDSQVNKVNEFKDEEIDDFFVYFLRSRFANTIGESRKFDKNYHRTMFSKDVDENLKLNHNPSSVKDFLKNDFKYYTNLYHKILKYSREMTIGYEQIYYNNLVEMDSQFLLILSSCKLNDENEEEKIKKISYEVNRFFTLLQLQRSYDSNDFNISVYKINERIREADINDFRNIFDEHLVKLISDNRGFKEDESFSYGLFKDVGIELSKRFRRYFFARVEYFIAQNTNLGMKHDFYDLVVNTGSVNGFHIEHILANNSENLKKFEGNQELFERERNRLGGLLLLKGKDNISSKNEIYIF